MKNSHIRLLAARQQHPEKSIFLCKHISKICTSTIRVSPWICVSWLRMLKDWRQHYFRLLYLANLVPPRLRYFVFELHSRDNSIQKLIRLLIQDWDCPGISPIKLTTWAPERSWTR